jgi:diguanylate cyclase (GGDEF)-like protein
MHGSFEKSTLSAGCGEHISDDSVLEHCGQGIILLDRKMRVRSVNRAARVIWGLNPLQYHNVSYAEFLLRAAAGAFQIHREVLEDFVIARYVAVEAGDDVPVDLSLPGGRVVRSQCSVTPDGGRIISFTDVSDLALRADCLERRLNVDTLTGLPNGREFLKHTAKAFDCFHKFRAPLSILMVDIDNLSEVNVRFSREIGDLAIIHVGSICQQHLRGADFLARRHEDQFGLVLPDTTAEQAFLFAEKLRRTVECTPMLFENIPVYLTISGGLAEADVQMDTPRTLCDAAANCLLLAQSRGGNETVRSANEIGSS